MSEIPKAYEPQAVEDRWYRFWLDRKCFVADPARVSDKRPGYSIVIPPPNVTGVLHMGHVLNDTIQDILARKARMDGKEVLWLPGMDHAGIATEGMVARQLWKDEKKTKRDIGREEFIKRVWTWKEKHGGIIIEQLKKLGCSCDWTRLSFTMDDHYVRCVQKVFVELYKKGLIYRGKRMVNWCPATLTALSDEEVDMEAQKGFLYYFKVQVVETDGLPVKVAGIPLTPALSPSRGEGEIRAAGEEKNRETRHTSDSLPPIGGEGQGEGTARIGGPLTDSEGRTWLTIATTRPETIPGDTAMAVNPKDTRYAHLIGKHVIRPLPAQLPQEKKLIPIIGDEYVDFEFGTGVLKVTPAHDKNDFDIGQRHGLPAVDIMNPNGTMNELAGESLAGLDRFEARTVAVERLKELGALVKEEPYENKIGFSQRAKVPIEPRLSEQWFLKYPGVEQSKECVEQEDEMGSARASRAAVSALADGPECTAARDAGSVGSRTSAADEASAAAREGACAPQKMCFHPQRWAKVYGHWLTNIQDWCISRQLWWGHRIPVWTRRVTFSGTNWDKGVDCAGWLGWEREFLAKVLPTGIARAVNVNSKEAFSDLNRDVPANGQTYDVFVATTDDTAAKTLEQHGFTQDPDVLDTWFSSWLWPFATMGWPEQTETLKKFYPTTDLVTAPDIIFFWVARMIMAGYEFMGQMPFRNVYFTGLIRDKLGRKMSKTLGNSPDPLELIAKYGADALRFGTMRSAPLGQDVLFDEKDVELGRNFCNKLWNACRFRQMQSAAGIMPADETSTEGQNFRQDAGTTIEVQDEINPALLTSDDKWILLKLDQAIREITTAFTEYKFNEATATLYRFFWSEYCDWYVEASKAVLAGSRRGNDAGQSLTTNPPPHVGGYDETHRANKLAVIDFVLSHTLRLFHPFLPFITEELWHGMGYAEDMPENQGGQTIMNAPWPEPLDTDFKEHYGLDDCYLEFVEKKYQLVTLGRNLRREYNISANKKVKFILRSTNGVSPHDVEVLKILLNAELLDVRADYESPKGTPAVHSELGDLYLPLEGVIDMAAEKARLQKELAKSEGEVQKVEQKLNNPAFVQKVPPAVLAEHQQRLAEWQAKRAKVQAALDSL